ncbi:mCG147087 [Mus musculus]|nr:mCG147087 [Mus musculus]
MKKKTENQGLTPTLDPKWLTVWVRGASLLCLRSQAARQKTWLVVYIDLLPCGLPNEEQFQNHRESECIEFLKKHKAFFRLNTLLF